jgi:putative transposase
VTQLSRAYEQANDYAAPEEFRFPRELIAYAVWAYHRFALSTTEVEDLLPARGVFVSREAFRLWVNRFGRHLNDCIRRDRNLAPTGSQLKEAFRQD